MHNEFKRDMKEIIGKSIEKGLKAIIHPAAYDGHQAIERLPREKWDDVLDDVSENVWHFLLEKGLIRKQED